MIASPPGVSVATVLRDLVESRAIDLELLAGAGGIDRRITNPHPQKTGLALAGFDQFLRDGRVLVFGESEVRFLESLAEPDRGGVLQRVFGHALPCLVITDDVLPPPEVAIEADRANVPCPGRCRPVMASGRASRSRPRPRSVRSWLRCVRFFVECGGVPGATATRNELVRIQGNAHRSSEDLG